MEIDGQKKNFFRISGNKKNIFLIGVSLTICAAVFEALSDVLPKPLMSSSQIIPLNPLLLVVLTYALNTALFTPFTRKTPSLKSIGKNSILLLSAIGIVEVFSSIFFFYGLNETSAINAAIISNSEIVFGVIIAMIVLKEKLKKWEILPFSLLIAGCIVIPVFQNLLYSKTTELAIGDLFVLASGLCLGIVMSMYRYASTKIDSKRIIQYTSLIGTVVGLAGLAILQIPFNVDTEHIPMIILVGVLGVGLPAFLIVLALKMIGAVRTILIFSSTTVFAVLFSKIFLGEEIFAENILSILLVIAGTYILRKKITE